MNFTREPIIETVITPKDGCKLVIRRSKTTGDEEYVVEAVEVISFGSALFFRSLDRMKTFLVPVGDYEVLERREQKIALKTPVIEKSIKISGGNTFTRKDDEASPPVEEEKRDRRDKRKGRKGRNKAEKLEKEQPYQQQELVVAPPVVATATSEEQVSPNVVRKLIPPPSTLIKEHLSRYRQFEEQPKEVIAPDEVSYPAPQAELAVVEETPPLPFSQEIKEESTGEKVDI